MNMATKQPGVFDDSEELQKWFNLYDTDRVGKITIKDLKEVALELKEEIDDPHLEWMMRKVINYKKFIISWILIVLVM